MNLIVLNRIIKDSAKFSQTAEETGGKLTEIEITVRPKKAGKKSGSWTSVVKINLQTPNNMKSSLSADRQAPDH